MDFSDSFDDLFPKDALKGILHDNEDDLQDDDLHEERKVWSVSELLFHINCLLDVEYGTIWIEGEVGRVSVPPSGHYFFNLKDDRSCVKSVCFKKNQGDVAGYIKEGSRILCLARVNVYQARGDLQIIVEHVEPWGAGRLKLEFERLKERLQNEGLFDQRHKKALPTWPQKIFLITSPSGAAFKDFVKTAKKKFPPARITLVPSLVQGDEAPKGLMAALDIAEAVAKEGDVIVLTRGGGSIEDLWAFNDESLARRIFACKVPVVSAIGHEVDFTICDLVADVRAPTPTAAADIVCPSSRSLSDELLAIRNRLSKEVSHLILLRRHALDLTASRLRHPANRLIEQRLRLSDIERRLSGAMTGVLSQKADAISHLRNQLLTKGPQNRLSRLSYMLQQVSFRLKGCMSSYLYAKKEQFFQLEARLRSSDPNLCKKKGFALLRCPVTKRPISSVTMVEKGQDLSVELKDGHLACKVLEIKKE